MSAAARCHLAPRLTARLCLAPRLTARCHLATRLPARLGLAAVALVALVALGATLAAAAAQQSPPGASSPQPSPPSPVPAETATPSNRSQEVLRLDCANRLGRREVTLFGNGTIRLRDGPVGKEWMGLAELNPDELQGTLRRLEQEDLADATDMPAGVAGDWVEKCDLVLELVGRKRQKVFFGRYDPQPLSLAHVLRVAEELSAKVQVLRDAEQLPEHYEPRFGDILKRADGNRYRVVNFTSDKRGVELDGIDQPLYLIVLKEQMRLEFVALVSRASP